MIKTKLPLLEKEIDGDGKLVVNKSEIEIGIDTSLFAEERWESNFPAQAKTETLFAYVERIGKAGLADSKAHILSNLKALYCFIDSDKLPDYKSFLKLFDWRTASILPPLPIKSNTFLKLHFKGQRQTQKTCNARRGIYAVVGDLQTA